MCVLQKHIFFCVDAHGVNKNYNLFFQKIKNQSEEEREKKLIIWIYEQKSIKLKYI